MNLIITNVTVLQSVMPLCDWSEPLAVNPQCASRRTRASVVELV